MGGFRGDVRCNACEMQLENMYPFMSFKNGRMYELGSNTNIEQKSHGTSPTPRPNCGLVQIFKIKNSLNASHTNPLEIRKGPSACTMVVAGQHDIHRIRQIIPLRHSLKRFFVAFTYFVYCLNTTGVVGNICAVTNIYLG